MRGGAREEEEGGKELALKHKGRLIPRRTPDVVSIRLCVQMDSMGRVSTE